MSKKDDLKIPEIYQACAHPQAVWFECHWRPIIQELVDFAKRVATDNVSLGGITANTEDAKKLLEKYERRT